SAIPTNTAWFRSASASSFRSGPPPRSLSARRTILTHPAREFVLPGPFTAHSAPSPLSCGHIRRADMGVGRAWLAWVFAEPGGRVVRFRDIGDLTQAERRGARGSIALVSTRTGSRPFLQPVRAKGLTRQSPFGQTIQSSTTQVSRARLESVPGRKRPSHGAALTNSTQGGAR